MENEKRGNAESQKTESLFKMKQQRREDAENAETQEFASFFPPFSFPFPHH